MQQQPMAEHKNSAFLSFYKSAGQWVDRAIPTAILTDPYNVGRARTLIYAVLLTVMVAVLTAIKDMYFESTLRSVFALSVTLTLGLTLALLWTRLGLRGASHYLLLVVILALHIRLILDPQGSQLVVAVCGVGLLAAHLISARAGGIWTSIALTLAALNATRLGWSGSPEEEAAWTIAIITAAIGYWSSVDARNRETTLDVAGAVNAQAKTDRDRLKIFAESAFPGIIEVSPGKIDYASEGVEQLLGYNVQKFSTLGLQDYVHNDDFWSVVATLRANPSTVSQVEARLRHARGHWTWIAAFAIPYPGQANEDRWIFAARDIESERRERELDRQSERLDGVGLLAAGVAHDFNNLLTVIAGTADLLSTGEEKDQILQAADEAASLTQRLLAFGKEQPHQQKNFDLRVFFTHLAPMLRSLLGEEIVLDIDTRTEPCLIHSDPTQLNQVVLNLVTNARDAMPRSGTLTITIDQVLLSDRRTHELGLPSNTMVLLSIQDSGVGMNTETLAHAFDPFFTTKSKSRGSGLGLASAYGTIKRNGGHLQLESTPGQGTRVSIWIPIATQVEPAKTLNDSVRDAPTFAGKILVVEDDPRILTLMCNTLQQAGFTILAARSGEEALTVFHQMQQPLELLVTDVVMPGMRGSVVAQQMRSKFPNLKILFVSGYSDVELGSWYQSDDSVAFLAKPFTPAQLVHLVADLIANVNQTPRPTSTITPVLSSQSH